MDRRYVADSKTVKKVLDLRGTYHGLHNASASELRVLWSGTSSKR